MSEEAKLSAIKMVCTAVCWVAFWAAVAYTATHSGFEIEFADPPPSIEATPTNNP